jgi:hypothetical protein
LNLKLKNKVVIINMTFKEVNGKEIQDDLFSIRDKQLEEETPIEIFDKAKPKKVRKPRTPKKKE